MNPRRKKKWLQSSERKDKKEGELDFFFFFLHGERSLDLDISLDVQIESSLESIQDYSAPNLNSPNNFCEYISNKSWNKLLEIRNQSRIK